MIDTQTWLDLLWFRDARTAALRVALDARRVEVVHDAYGLAEWKRVLGYPTLGIDTPSHADLIMQFHRYSRMHGSQPSYGVASPAALPRCRDPADQPFLQLALVAAAQFLVSRDNALLALDRRCRRSAGFAVVTADSDALRAALDRSAGDELRTNPQH